MSEIERLLVPLNEACTMLGLCRQTLYRMEKDKEIRFVRIRGRTLVPMAEVRRFAEPASEPVGDPVADLEKTRVKKIQLFPMVT